MAHIYLHCLFFIRYLGNYIVLQFPQKQFYIFLQIDSTLETYIIQRNCAISYRFSHYNRFVELDGQQLYILTNDKLLNERKHTHR